MNVKMRNGQLKSDPNEFKDMTETMITKMRNYLNFINKTTTFSKLQLVLLQ